MKVQFLPAAPGFVVMHLEQNWHEPIEVWLKDAEVHTLRAALAIYVKGVPSTYVSQADTTNARSDQASDSRPA